MEIKNVENFSLEECRAHLNSHPNGPERSSVEDRLDAILHQKMYSEEQEEKQRSSEQECLTIDVQWIDIKQFLSKHKYRNLSKTKIILKLLVLIGIIIAFCVPEDTIGFVFVFLVIIPAMLVLAISVFDSPSLPNIYNIEQEEKTKFIRRTQNTAGKFGLHLRKKRRIIQLLPMDYDNIYYCGGNAYVCVKGNKMGVYNAFVKRMVINIEYDSIEIVKDGTLLVSKNGVYSKLTTEGYRIIE